MDTYTITLTDEEMGTLMAAVQCAMLEANYQNNEVMMDRCDAIFTRLAHCMEGKN